MAAVKPERILKDLGKLWVDLGKQDANGVLRACTMTFVVVVEESRDAASVGETIAALMHEHPSRAIVVRVRGGEECPLEARVFAQCWMPFGRRQQICCEQVEIIASLESLPDVPAVLRGLIVADLPVVLYCPSENLWRLQEFQALLPLASKLILDSHALGNSLRVAGYLQNLPQLTGPRRADLAWSRLTPWREAVSRAFDEPERAAKIYEMEEIQILYKGPDEPAALYYLGGWFMHVLGGGVKLNTAVGVGPDHASIQSVALMGPGLKVEIELVDPTTVEIRANGVREQVAVFPNISEYEALRQELSVAGRDRVFEDVLGLATLMRGIT